MKKQIRGRVAFALALCMLGGTLGGCKGTRNETAAQEKKETAASAAMGRYMEEEMMLPDGAAFIYDGKALEDGSIRVAAYNGDVCVYETKDNAKTWEQTLSLNESMGKEDSYAICGALSPDGSLFCQLFEKSGENDYVYKTVKVAPDKTAAEVSLGEGRDILSSLHYIEDGKILAHRMGDTQITLYDDATGETLRTYDPHCGEIQFFGVANDQIIAMGQKEAAVLDYESGEVSEFGALEEVLKEDKNNFIMGTSNAYPIVFCAGNKADEVYFCNRGGIYRCLADGAMAERVADGSLNSLSAPNVNLESMQALADGSFIVFARKDADAVMLRYTYDGNVPALPGTELKVYALEEDLTLRQIVSNFQTRNPEYYVNLEIGVTGEDAVTISDALRTLNTEMVAGSGPDVLILDGMPIDSYIERGILADISDVVEKVKSTDGVWENIAGAYEKAGALYAVPTRFKVPALVGKSEALDGITDFASLTDAVQKLRAENDGTEEIVNFPTIYWGLHSLYSACSPALVGQDKGLDTQAVSVFVEQAKQIYDQNEYTFQSDEARSVTRGVSEYGYDFSTVTPLINIIWGQSVMGVCNLANCDALQEIKTVRDILDVGWTPAKLSGKNVYLPAQVAGICSRTEQMEGAKAFVEYFLSKDAQALNSGSGFPVNRAAFSEELQKEASMSTGATIKEDDGSEHEVMLDYQSLDEEEQEQFSKAVELLDTPALTDAVLEDMVLEQTGQCLRGDITADDAVRSISQKMSLYLAE